MMYVGYPKLSENQRIEQLGELDKLPETLRLPADIPQENISNLQLEMRQNQLSFIYKNQQNQLSASLAETARPWSNTNAQQAMEIAAQFNGAPIMAVEEIERDQWTVYSRYHQHRPLFKVTVSDPDATELYISSRSGQVVQATTEFQRGWSWLGAVSHWLYPTFLRQHASFWYWLVIVLTLLALLSTLTGIWLGLKQIRKKKQRLKGKGVSPYRGISKLHHIGGLAFSLFLLLFLFSGLLSMNPWGLLESSRPPHSQALKQSVDYASLQQSLNVIAGKKKPHIKQLRLAPRFGQANWIVSFSDGSRERWDQYGNKILINSDYMNMIAAGLSGNGIDVHHQIDYDHYYYGHKKEKHLPVWRLENQHNSDNHWFYFDAETAEMSLFLDSNRRWYRWLFNALHSWDFSSSVRQRPIWDLLLVPPLILLSLFGLTSLIIAKRRLLR